MDEFLLESLLADALLLEEWGLYTEGLHDQPPACPQAIERPSGSAPGHGSATEASYPPSAFASTSATTMEPEADVDSTRTADEEPSAREILEFRRRRNRELMQRTRRRQKDGIEAMRTTLEALSYEFEQLRAQQQRSVDSPCDLLEHSTVFSQLEADYGSLAETSHRLNAENFLLQRLIVEREKVKLKLLDAIDTSDISVVGTDTATPHQGSAAAFFGYTEMSLEQAQDAMNSCYRRIVQYEQTAQPLAYWIMDADGPCRTFGWTVSCEISTGNNFFLSMTKRLPGVTPREAMERSWAAMSQGCKVSNRPSRRVARSEVLQTLNDSTCIIGDDVHHPIKAGVRMRSITVCFRLATKKGYAVGTGSVNHRQPRAPHKHSQPAVEYVDAFSWHDFAQDDDGSGCIVSLKSLTQYNTDENLRLRLTNALCFTWRWESEVMKSPVRLLAA